MLPQNLILIRHGESEGNLIVHKTRNNDNSLYDPKMENAHTSFWRLSERGVVQAQQTGEWLKNNTFLENINKRIQPINFYVSDYIRAIETAYELNLENVCWQITSEVRERMYGDIDFLYKKEEFEKKFEKNLKQRKENNFHWIPQNGESIATTFERAANFIHRVLDTPTKNDVVIVTHGEFMWAVRMIFNEITIPEYEILREEKSIYNCQITEFSHPINNTKYHWVRHYVPSTPDYHNWIRKEIEQKYYTNNDLAKIIKYYPRLVKYQ